jgi:nicotinic acid mononucleotide adenylyltransferase
MPGAFNPPTRAHVALAHAALDYADAVLFAIPSRFPHKEFEGATIEQRITMLTRISAPHDRLGTVVTDGGLYFDIAMEAREQFPTSRIALLCGRDAAERIVGWHYDEPDLVEQMLDQFELLVAARQGRYEPPGHLRPRIKHLEIPHLDDCSSSRLREMIQRDERWRDLAPEEISQLVAEIYGRNL